MEYRRISRDYWDYALYPKSINVYDIINKFGPKEEYYSSIYSYSEEQYKKYISGLQKVCGRFKIRYDEDDLLNIVANLRRTIKSQVKANKIDKNEADFLNSLFSVAGTLDVKTNKLVFDFDDEKNIEQARKDTVELYSRLITNGFLPESIQISFSGNKGFSVEIETDTYLSRPEFENIVTNLSENLVTFDPSVKDQQRLFRIPMTRNKKTGLYKIPLTIGELHDLTIDIIKDDASPDLVKENLHVYKQTMESWTPIKLPKAIHELKDKSVKEKQESEEQKDIDDSLDLTRRPPWLSPTKFALQEGFFEKGERNTALMILAATYKANGFPERVAYGMLKAVADLQAQRTGMDKFPKDEIWNNIVQIVYGPNWRGGTYSEKETELLQQISTKFGINEAGETGRTLTDIGTSLGRFLEYAKNFSKNKITLGLPSLDEKVVITTGMAVGLLGSAGSGKTSIALTFMKQLSMTGEKVLFECLDMTENFIIARMLQGYTRYSFQEILGKIERGEVDESLEAAMKLLQEEYKNMHINYKSGTNIEDIENDIKMHHRMFGVYPRLVVVDYLEKIRGPFSDNPVANIGYIASRLTDLAREYGCCLIMVLQPQKTAGDAREPLLSMRKIKGSSVIEQDCRIIMTMWRPGFNPEDNSNDKYASIAVVKNNLGESCKLDYRWDGVSGKFREMTDDERYEFNEFQEILKAQKEEQEQESW
jgi:replicative DNA helicase